MKLGSILIITPFTKEEIPAHSYLHCSIEIPSTVISSCAPLVQFHLHLTRWNPLGVFGIFNACIWVDVNVEVDPFYN